MVEKTLEKIYQSIPLIREFPFGHIWIDYDKGADVLYISFEKPQRATDSILTENNILIRKRDGKIIGLTIINVSKFENK
ncbi:MAG: hypothetical protein COT33_01155 [Candidatus Nealsonbacteria bacterium CG08_land_8_20_14_0_20_38_20]|uniref:DUF2283 domain-containing protein n=1 Tax=Candidatus Nealsonbacteria bacterium CG08_land_8_20_14_0_20_38_20 TaxID=1974705 RepID=A0A2H0YMB8_9BACT|nr:MAG: hypothetical protein COT33_01155 [Candidatus Nealsonbacteria bacterium CG08_land_8_20_14_0_20_38_20]